MNSIPGMSIQAAFGDMDDPRVSERCTYPLHEIILIALCGTLCGAETWTEIEAFGESQQEWLHTFLALEPGRPSHDTFRRVFNRLPAAAFQERFSRWVETTFQVERGQVIALDGKTVRGAGLRALHLVRAWAHQSGLLLGQRKVDEKSNEITALPQLLEELSVAGCIVTLDAMGC